MKKTHTHTHTVLFFYGEPSRIVVVFGRLWGAKPFVSATFTHRRFSIKFRSAVESPNWKWFRFEMIFEAKSIGNGAQISKTVLVVCKDGRQEPEPPLHPKRTAIPFMVPMSLPLMELGAWNCIYGDPFSLCGRLDKWNWGTHPPLP